MELWEVVARENIRDIVTRYNSNGDSGRFAQVIELFTADAVMEVLGQAHTGHDEIMTIFTRVVAHNATAGSPGHVRHMTATHQIDFVDESHATGRLYFQVLTRVGLDHWGRYLDQYRQVEGAWKFERRKVIVDGQSADSTFPHEE